MLGGKDPFIFTMLGLRSLMYQSTQQVSNIQIICLLCGSIAICFHSDMSSSDSHYINMFFVIGLCTNMVAGQGFLKCLFGFHYNFNYSI
jgi:hypothetical protein